MLKTAHVGDEVTGMFGRLRWASGLSTGKAVDWLRCSSGVAERNERLRDEFATAVASQVAAHGDERLYVAVRVTLRCGGRGLARLARLLLMPGSADLNVWLGRPRRSPSGMVWAVNANGDDVSVESFHDRLLARVTIEGLSTQLTQCGPWRGSAAEWNEWFMRRSG
jgi:hypothetical protein